MGAEILLPDHPSRGDGEEVGDLGVEGGSASGPGSLYAPEQQHAIAEVPDFFGRVLKFAQFGNPLPVVAEAPVATAIDRIEPDESSVGSRDRLEERTSFEFS
jgi:hypothetical protein